MHPRVHVRVRAWMGVVAPVARERGVAPDNPTDLLPPCDKGGKVFRDLQR